MTGRRPCWWTRMSGCRWFPSKAPWVSPYALQRAFMRSNNVAIRPLSWVSFMGIGLGF